jgi:acylphosphatase
MQETGVVRRVHVIVSGRVQGVFYRATCVERARALGVKGWVRNTFDGQVEAEFEGDDAAVEAMVAWAREGPAGADVRACELRERPVVGDEGFRVIR